MLCLTESDVSVADLVAMVNIILGKKGKMSEADLNGDGDVTVGDYVILVNIVLGKNN